MFTVIDLDEVKSVILGQFMTSIVMLDKAEPEMQFW